MNKSVSFSWKTPNCLGGWPQTFEPVISHCSEKLHLMPVISEVAPVDQKGQTTRKVRSEKIKQQLQSILFISSPPPSGLIRTSGVQMMNSHTGKKNNTQLSADWRNTSRLHHSCSTPSTALRRLNIHQAIKTCTWDSTQQVKYDRMKTKYTQHEVHRDASSEVNVKRLYIYIYI